MGARSVASKLGASPACRLHLSWARSDIVCRANRPRAAADADRASSRTARDREVATTGSSADAQTTEASRRTWRRSTRRAQRLVGRRPALRRRDQSPPRIARPPSTPARSRSRGLRRSPDPRGRAIRSLARQLRAVQGGRAERMQLVAGGAERVHQGLSPRDVERRPRRRSLREHEEPDGEGGLVRLLHGAGRRGVVGARLPLTPTATRATGWSRMDALRGGG